MLEPTELKATRCWVEKTVIGLNLCPFAAGPVKAGRIRYQLCVSGSPEGIYRELLAEMESLVGLTEAEAESSLFVVPKGLDDFDAYLELFAIAEGAIPEAGLEGILQLASFHPHYCFDGVEQYDPANYTNRSPYPMFHLIREAPLAKALEGFKDPEGIPKRNIKLLREMGLEEMRQRLLDCLP
jgi:hypothetical protein